MRALWCAVRLRACLRWWCAAAGLAKGTPRLLRLASAVCTGLRDSCCGEPLAEGYNNAQNCWPTRTQQLPSALHAASCANCARDRKCVHAPQTSCRSAYLTYGSVAKRCSSCEQPPATAPEWQSGSDAQQPRRITPCDRRRGWCHTRSAIKTIANSEAKRKIIPRALRPARVPLSNSLENITPPNSGRNTAQRSNSSEARPTYSGSRRDAFEARSVLRE